VRETAGVLLVKSLQEPEAFHVSCNHIFYNDIQQRFVSAAKRLASLIAGSYLQRSERLS
jgi:hypothetical protein